MDNETIRSMLSSQGMSFSNQDIEFLKNAMTPETLKLMKNSNMKMPQIPMNQQSLSNQSSSPSLSQQEPLSSISSSPQMPNLGNMDYKSMLNFIKSNPEMLKMISPQLSQMMGGKEANPEFLMNAMEKILWLLNIPSEIKKFCKSKKGICIIILLLALIITHFYRK